MSVAANGTLSTRNDLNPSTRSTTTALGAATFTANYDHFVVDQAPGDA